MKESIFKRFGFLFGVLTTLLCLAGAWGLLSQYATSTGTLFVIGQTGISQVDGSAILDAETVKKVDEVYKYLSLYYYGDYSKDEIQEALVSGMVAGMDDPYTVYYTAEEYADMQVSTSGTYYGIGAGLTQNVETMQVTVSKVYKGTPSEEAGMKNGDIIISANGIDATSVELSELVNHIRGEAGSKVEIVIYRESTKETLTLQVERRYVELPSVETEIIDGNIGYIIISDFQDKTDEQFEAAVKDLMEKGVKGLLLDVRANPGGYLDTVNNIADFLLPEGLIVYVQDKYGARVDHKSGASCIDLPMVLLVDGNSASASEILAGALKDYDYATLVGTTTFGKGIVQSLIPLKDKDALKLTTAKYFTPNGNDIHGVGIEPDVVIEYNYSGPQDKDYDKQYDNQYLKGLEVLKEKLAK